MYEGYQKKCAQETSKESQSGARDEVLFGAWQEETSLDNLLRSYTSTGTLLKIEQKWQKEPQRHCEEVFTDQEGPKEEQQKRIEYVKKKGDQQFTVDWRNAEDHS